MREGMVTVVERFEIPRARALAGASDVELALGLCLRDLDSLDELFRRHATQVAHTVRRTAGRRFVDDVVQEVFLLLWRAPERFHPERGSLAAYLVCLTRGRAIDALRSDAAWHRRQRDHGYGSEVADEEEVEAVVLARVSAGELQSALSALPMSERVVIELAFFGGYSYRQVAVQLGQPEGTVKSRIRFGLRRLETMLTPATAAGS